MQIRELLIEEARRLTSHLKDTYKPEKIILFGSSVWAETTKDSDIDLFIIKSTQENFLDRIRKVYSLLCKLNYEFAVEPLIYTPEEVAKRIKLGDMFVKKILTKGKILYERQQ